MLFMCYVYAMYVLYMLWSHNSFSSLSHEKKDDTSILSLSFLPFHRISWPNLGRKTSSSHDGFSSSCPSPLPSWESRRVCSGWLERRKWLETWIKTKLLRKERVTQWNLLLFLCVLHLKWWSHYCPSGLLLSILDCLNECVTWDDAIPFLDWTPLSLCARNMRLSVNPQTGKTARVHLLWWEGEGRKKDDLPGKKESSKTDFSPSRSIKGGGVTLPSYLLHLIHMFSHRQESI